MVEGPELQPEGGHVGGRPQQPHRAGHQVGEEAEPERTLDGGRGRGALLEHGGDGVEHRRTER